MGVDKEESRAKTKSKGAKKREIDASLFSPHTLFAFLLLIFASLREILLRQSTRFRKLNN
jgi:hypothetical protein